MRSFVLIVAITLFTAVPSFAQTDAVDPSVLGRVDPAGDETANADRNQPPRRGVSKWWSIAMASGYMADGATTWWAMSQPGPAAKIRETNGFYHKLFGPDVKGWQVMAFKTGQAAVLGFGLHQIAKHTPGKERVVYVAVLHTVVSGVISTVNIKRGLSARRLNAAYAVQW